MAEVCRRYGSSVLRRCRAILRDAQAAEDAAQEVLVTFATKGHTFRGDAELSTWLYRVSTNLCLNRLRGEGRRQRREAAGESYAGAPPADPERRAEARDLLDLVAARLDRLGQAVLIHRYLDGMTQEEIAETTNTSRRTVCNRLERIAEIVADLRRSP